VVQSKPRRPRAWVPPTVLPNLTEGVHTKGLAAQVLDYEQQRRNDDTICDVLADFGGYDALEDLVSPEEQRSVGSMDTCNINLWDSVFRDDAWRTSAPILKRTGFGATHPGGSLERPVLIEVGIMPDRFQGTYVHWSCKRAGWAVLVPNRFLSEASFHTGDTPSWTQGDVIGEGVHASTGKRMVLCNLGGYDTECHLNEDVVRVADGPHVRAYGSEGGHGYGWWKRQHCFSPLPDSGGVFGGVVADLSGSANLAGAASRQGSGNGPGLTEHVAENLGVNGIPLEPGCYPINDYETPSETVGVDGTQDSTARDTFPQVSRSLPDYMNCSFESMEPSIGLDMGVMSTDSSGEEWLPEFCDTLESSDSDFEVDNLDASEPPAPGLERWCMSPESFTPVPMDTAQLAEYYRKESWNSTRVDFVRSRDNFTGPTPGLKSPMRSGIPQPHSVFDLYWSDAVLDRIVLETNRYARSILPTVDNELPRTKGGRSWKDVNRSDIRAWLGICILMGCKRLPSVRQYWMRSQPFLYCSLISSIMTLGRWEDIMRCLHLVDNNSIVRDVNDPRFDRIAKTRWLVEMFNKVSKEIYNLEREITVDECVIPYKGRYCFIRQFMPDKPVRFGIKVWLLASSKSRFVWQMEVYFGERTGAGPHGLGYHVIERMVAGLENRGHCLVIDNFFASVNLFHDLMCKGIWATGTVRRTSKNLPRGLYREPDTTVRGSMLIWNHVHRQMGVVSWQDKKLVTLLSTAAAPWEPNSKVLRRIPGLRGQLVVPSSPMHQQYVEYMRGVDVTDQLRGNYSSQLRCHKWWVKIFHLIVDQTMVNSYVTWMRQMEELGLPVLTHLGFKIAVGKYLAAEVIQARRRGNVQHGPRPRHPRAVHTLFRSKLKRSCVICGRVQKWFCTACGHKWMCQEACYQAHHESL
jgi:hypothetical protein